MVVTKALSKTVKPASPSAATAFVGGRNWEKAEVLSTHGQFRLTAECEAKGDAATMPIFRAGMEFSLHVPRKVNTKGTLQVLDNRVSELRVRVFATGEVQVGSSKYRVLVAKLQHVGAGTWEAITCKPK